MSFARAGRRAAKRCVVTSDLRLWDAVPVSMPLGDVEHFHSRREAKRWIELTLLERAGAIRDLRRQQRFDLHCCLGAGCSAATVTHYTADFVYDEAVGQQWHPIVEDCKGFREREYLLRRKWMRLEHGIVIRET